MSGLIEIITSRDPNVRNRPLEAFCRGLSAVDLLKECANLEEFRLRSDNLYERVRALFFLYAIHRFHLPPRTGNAVSRIPYDGYSHLLKRRFEESIKSFLAAQAEDGANAAISSALAAAYRSLGFQTLADQVRRSVRSVRGNQWMFRTSHPSDYPLRIRPELLEQGGVALFPIVAEATPVRMDLTHSGWSDIFFLGMDFPEGARVLNISIDLAVRGPRTAAPKPPVEAYLRVIDEPVLRLTSVDLKASTDVRNVAEVFDFARDYLGLPKAAVIASGIIPPGMEGATQPLAEILRKLTGRAGHGIEIVSKVNDIPKGSRLAVSTNLLACLITVCMRATRQVQALEGGLSEDERRLVAARAILGEWLAGSGGGWQDSGGVWPGIKLIHGVEAVEGDPEFGISRGCLLPRHRLMEAADAPPQLRERLQESLVLVHGGMAQDVGPILEMVTERYLLRSEAEWRGRMEAIALLDQVLEHMRHVDIGKIGECTNRNFAGPIQTIIPWASNLYTEMLIEKARAAGGDGFSGFWMLGGMAGGGMGFLFKPGLKPAVQDRMQEIMSATKKSLEAAVPFAMEPVVYDFAINERGTHATLAKSDRALMPPEYYTLVAPDLVRMEPRLLSPARRAELTHFSAACRNNTAFSAMVQDLFDHLLPRTAETGTTGNDHLDTLLARYGFDREQHEQIQADLRAGRIGIAQNRLPASSRVEDVSAEDYFDATGAAAERFAATGKRALKDGEVAVISLAGGIGSRWTKGAGVVKALNPFCRLGGRQRSFVEVHLAKSLRTARESGAQVPHVVTTSYLTHRAIESYLQAEENYGYPGTLLLSPGARIGLRLIPMERDLRFAWEETQHQILDEQAQKVRESLQATLIDWARRTGEGANYTDNLPEQCLHPVGHWYEVPNLLLNGTLARLLERHPGLKYLFVHNIDTVGAGLDPALLGYHIEQDCTMTAEVIARYVEDRGGGLARVDGRARLIEGLALPSEEIESTLSFYNSASYWIDIDRLLAVFGLARGSLGDAAAVAAAIRAVASRMPTYVTLKDVKKRWGKGQEDVFPVAQFEKLWGDMTALPEMDCRFVVVPRMRGQQLKEPAQLDGWLRDGSAAYVESGCEWRRRLAGRG
jgi:hypothetical protein